MVGQIFTEHDVTLRLPRWELEELMQLCAGEVEDFETDGGYYTRYAAAKDFLKRAIYERIPYEMRDSIMPLTLRFKTPILFGVERNLPVIVDAARQFPGQLSTLIVLKDAPRKALVMRTLTDKFRDFVRSTKQSPCGEIRLENDSLIKVIGPRQHNGVRSYGICGEAPHLLVIDELFQPGPEAPRDAQ